MKWPWVSRETYAAAVREAETWRAEYRAMQSRYFDAVTPRQPTLTYTEPANEPVKKRPSPIAAAIKQESGGDPRLAGYLRKRARELRAEGMVPADIAVELVRWQTTEEAGAGAE